uniref:MADF domain-containing protein n=1 Tax=Timema douglasi TaxID=61478 RepID=A0A7R8VNJ9_TIMDO|nr:unnamed protein product [Timema douglasi]
MEWSRTQTFKLIQAFKGHDILWDSTRDDYRDRAKKLCAWAAVASQVGASVDECRKRMESMLASFRRERAKVVKSARSPVGGYRPKWAYWKELVFLCDSNVLRGLADNLACHLVSLQSIGQRSALLVSDLEVLGLVSGGITGIFPQCGGGEGVEASKRNSLRVPEALPPPPPEERPAPSTSKEEYFRVHVPQNKYRKVLSEPVYPAPPPVDEDSMDVFGKFVAQELRSVEDKKTQCILKHRIHTIIFETRMEMFDAVHQEVPAVEVDHLFDPLSVAIKNEYHDNGPQIAAASEAYGVSYVVPARRKVRAPESPDSTRSDTSNSVRLDND